MTSPGHGQEQRADARHSRCCRMLEHAPKPKNQCLYLWQCLRTWVHFMHGLVLWICLEKSTNSSQRPGKPPPGHPTPPHPGLGGLWTTTGVELKGTRTSGTGLGAGGAGANSLVVVGLLPAPCPRSSQTLGCIPHPGGRTHTHTWIPPVDGCSWL